MLPIIKSVGKNYQFIDKWKKEDMESDVIKLPAMPRSGEPGKNLLLELARISSGCSFSD